MRCISYKLTRPLPRPANGNSRLAALARYQPLSEAEEALLLGMRQAAALVGGRAGMKIKREATRLSLLWETAKLAKARKAKK